MRTINPLLPKKRRLTPHLILGLALALAIHLLFFLTFSIAHLPAPNTAPLPPITVEVDLTTSTRQPIKTAKPLSLKETPKPPPLPRPHFFPRPTPELPTPDFSSLEHIPYTIEEHL